MFFTNLKFIESQSCKYQDSEKQSLNYQSHIWGSALELSVHDESDSVRLEEI